MKLPSKHLENAVEQLASLPGIGQRTALRLALHLINRSDEEIKRFSSSFTAMKDHVKQCEKCGNISDESICAICQNPKRDETLVCVVEDIRDILAIESTEAYQGLYHVLGGIISPMDGIGPSDLNIQSLIERCTSGNVKEVIFALSPTMEGDTTNYFLYKKIGHLNINISVLSRGVSVGTELHFADELTLSRSLLNRQPFSY